MTEGFRFHAFGFSLAEYLSAQCMGYLGATFTQVFTRTGGADVSLRDVTIAQMENGARECGWRHAPEARGGFGGFWKIQLVELSPAPEEDGWLSLACRSQASGLVLGAARDGGRWKSQNRKNVYLSPYVEEPLNSKVIKSFVPELRSRKCFSCFGISTFYVYVYMLWTFYVRFAYPYHGYDTYVVSNMLPICWAWVWVWVMG